MEFLENVWSFRIVCQFQVVIISKQSKVDSDIQLSCFEEWILGGAFLVVELPTSAASDFVIVIALIKMMKKVAHF